MSASVLYPQGNAGSRFLPLPIQLQILLVLSFILTVSGCGPDNNGKNQAPEIVSISASSTTVEPDSTVALSVLAVDEDGDVLSYQWAASGGDFVTSSILRESH